jgi:hypothetical protein
MRVFWVGWRTVTHIHAYALYICLSQRGMVSLCIGFAAGDVGRCLTFGLDILLVSPRQTGIDSKKKAYISFLLMLVRL